MQMSGITIERKQRERGRGGRERKKEREDMYKYIHT